VIRGTPPPHTLRLVISLGGDADTQGAIAGAVAEAFWGRIPDDLRTEVEDILPADMVKIIADTKRSKGSAVKTPPLGEQ
jgi:ADP-ribosylglycohydrolase